MKRPTLLLLPLLTLLACLNDTKSTGPGLRPNAVISDGAHDADGDGSLEHPHFFFLPPMVPAPTPDAAFNGSLQPAVQICELNVATEECIGDGVEFTMTTGPGSETIRRNSVEKHYIVNWHTDVTGAVEGSTYRILVRAAPTPPGGPRQEILGFADVEIASSGKEAKSLATNQLIALVDGRTLPIKFYPGIGALGQCTAGGPTCAEAVVPPAGGLVVAVNADGEAEAFADFPDGWTDEPTAVQLERINEVLFPKPLGAPADMRQWPLFYEFTTDRPGLRFARRVRIGVCNFDVPLTDPSHPLTDPSHPEDRGNLSLGIGAGENFRTLPLESAADILGLCEGVTGLASANVGGGGWRGWIARAAALATRVVMPQPLHARSAVVVDGGMGGSTDGFSSPVGTVEGRPDLVVESFTISPASPTTSDTITFTAVIRNIGDLHAGLTFAGIDVGGEPAPGQTFECPISDGIASLAPGEACTVTRRVVLDVAQNYLAIARADAVGDLATESNEENNTRELAFTVSEPPSGVITFEAYPDGSPTCDDCSVTDEFASEGVLFSFVTTVPTSVRNASLIQNRNNPEGNANNHDVTAPRLDQPSSHYGGLFTMTFVGTPEQVSFEGRVNNTVASYAVTAFDAFGGQIPAAQITFTDRVVYTPCEGCAEFRQELVTVTSSSGISRIDVDMNALVLIDDIGIVASTTVIDFERYPDGTAACGRCPLTNEFATRGVVFSFASTATTLTSATLNNVFYESAQNPRNHSVTSASTVGGVFVGVLSMTFAGLPRTVVFRWWTNNSITQFPVGAVDANGNPVAASQITRSNVATFTSIANVLMKLETVTVTSPVGIRRVDVDGSGFFTNVVDNLLIQP